MKFIVAIAIGLLINSNLLAQKVDVAAIHHYSSEELSLLLFENEGDYLSLADDPFTARTYEVDDPYPNLNVTGDFDGDGVDEIALFSDLLYKPNMNPDFTCSVIKVFKSAGEILRPQATWFSKLETSLDFGYVNFSVASDFNKDGLDDIALIYNDPSSEVQKLFVLESSGNDFSEPLPYYTTNRNEFNFTALKFACAGDFNGNDDPDIAVFYNYFGTAPETKQSIFIFESDGTSFSLLPGEAYNGTKQEYDFTEMQYALAGDFNRDGYSDVAAITKNPDNQDIIIPVFEGAEDCQMKPKIYSTILSSSMELEQIIHGLAGDFSGDPASDLMLFFDDPVSGGQEMLVFQSESTLFNPPLKYFVSSPYLMPFDEITSVFAGNFVYQALVTATTWKDDMKGALSFTFDDGYKGAFEFGAAELEAAGLKGTFNVFTDTAEVYDGELAPTSLVQEYKDRGHEIGSHTLNHSNLGFITGSGDMDSLNQVLSSSLSSLNKRYSQQTSGMSIPFGSFRYETLEVLSNYFLSARSSQYGFNLSTPYDFYALKSWPILSTTSPAFVGDLISEVEEYGYYLPLMYHDMTDKPFNEDSLIYNYSSDLFRETVLGMSERDVWVDTQEQICKYILARNALKIEGINQDNSETNSGQFSFVASCDLPDSLNDVELTLQIRLPDSWTGDSISIQIGDSFLLAEVLVDKQGGYALVNCNPGEGTEVHVSQGLLASTEIEEKVNQRGTLGLLAYPNPFTSETHIYIEGQLNPDMQLLLLDMNGRMVRDYAMQGRSSISLGGETLTPGLYMILLLDGGIPAANLKLVAQ